MIRYNNNECILSESDQIELDQKTVLIIGAGGLGGCVIEGLSRIGVGKLIICDGDIFSESNLNRQLLSTEKNIGENKALEAKKRVNLINSNVDVTAIDKQLDKEVLLSMLTQFKIDCIVDCVDNAESKVLFEDISVENKIPFIFGAVGAKEGYVAAINGKSIVKRLYSILRESPAVTNSFIAPTIVGAFQVQFAIRLMLDKTIRTDGIYLIDLQQLHINFLKL